VNYEAQAAIELEMAAHESTDESAYPFELRLMEKTWRIGTRPLFEWLLRDIRKGARPSDISRRFHNGLASLLLGLAEKLREAHGLNRVCLTGGCFQNILLFRLLLAALRKQNFEVYFHTEVPAGDGGISLGQALVATHRLRASEAGS